MKGFFSQRLYVTVPDEVTQNELEILGCYGTDPDRRKIMRREQSSICDTTCDSRSSVNLTLHEAFFLSHALRRLSIISDESKVLNSFECWSLFRQSFRNSNIKIDFSIEYGVYFYFRTRGWIVKSGSNYGTNFLLYEGSPSMGHSKYAVLVLFREDKIKGESHEWQTLLTYHRVIQSVSKELLLAYVSIQDFDDAKLEVMDCIKNMKIITRLFKATTNLHSF